LVSDVVVFTKENLPTSDAQPLGEIEDGSSSEGESEES